MAKYAAFSVPDAHRIKRAVHAVEGGPRTYANVGQRVPNNGGTRNRAYVVKIETAIPAAFGDVPGQSTLPLYQFGDDGVTLEPVLDRNGEQVEEDVYNLSEEESATGYSLVVEETRTGHLVLAVAGGGDSGLPPGDDGCDCGNCHAAPTIPDATQCCQSHLRWSLVNPWLECEDTDLTLEYAGADVWLTEPFDGPDCDGNQNEYRWKMQPDVDGTSYLTLVLETDNGCDDVCIVYGRESFNCQCDNDFAISKPYGKWAGVARDKLSCYACVSPMIDVGVPSDCTICGVSDVIYVRLSGFEDDGGTGCDNINGTYALDYSGQSPGHCSWALNPSLPEIVDACGTDLVDIFRYLQIQVSLTDDFATHVAIAVGGSDYSVDIDGESCVADSVTSVLPIAGTDVYCPNDSETPACSGGNIEIFWNGIGQPSSTGVCDETCDQTPAPEDSDDGTCCYQSVCYELWDEALCTDFGGVWNTDGCGECETTGTCIDEDGLCFQTTEYVCQTLGGTFTVGENCPTGSVTYDTQGDYTWTPGFTGTATAYVHGAGGGGVKYGSGDDGGGGGGGGVAIGTLSVTSGVGVTIRVGAGGAAGGGAGTAGGESYVGSSTTIRASGGGGANGAAGGSAGAGTHGTTLYTGGAGGTPTGGNGGCGGGSSAGTGSNGNSGASESGGSGGAGGVAPAGGGKGGDGGGTGVEGIDGEGPGGGGGGAGNGANLGGNGHDGRVYITW